MRVPIAGYEGIYEIDDRGVVWSYRAKGRGGVMGKLVSAPRPLRGQIVGGGYRRTILCRERKQRLVYIHRLVAEHFIGPCPPGHQTNHRDGNKQNNAVENLEWVTPSQNQLHSARVLGKAFNPLRGEANPKAKVTDAIVHAIRSAYTAGGISQSNLALAYAISQTAVSNIIRHKTWAHVS